ncbi:cupin domain-containing protein [Paenibacillus sabinae]|uniref:AraC family transcriptional regulator n=1 Tax=Paenibacillus sabinae T27 TaxID=1268072 RepID=X5A0K1_9BACL|nr:AraC family ligand binding domain-containing protein [Paenibacillus sabinae]AHV97923.1 AraC family transcriptional regulator [Paenibacillus sabinae T27]
MEEIYYCNGRKLKEPGEYPRKITRTLPYHQLAILTGGTGRMIVGGKRFLGKEGMLFYIRPGVSHSIELDKERSCSFLSVHFSYARVSLNDGKWNLSPAIIDCHLPQYQKVKSELLYFFKGSKPKLAVENKTRLKMEKHLQILYCCKSYPTTKKEMTDATPVYQRNSRITRATTS